jgi:hypothetical protein
MMGRLGERQSAARTSDASADVALLRREEISKAMTSAFYRLVFRLFAVMAINFGAIKPLRILLVVERLPLTNA